MFKIDRAVIEINGGCNYTCRMCPQTNIDGTTGARGKAWLRKMPLDIFERAVSECAEAGLNVVNLEGSGEPTLNSDLAEYIKVVKRYNAKAFIFSNGYRMHGEFMKNCVDAGLDFFRFSIIGYTKALYKKWMGSENFDLVIDNLHKMQKYVTQTGASTKVSTYHLILDATNLEYEVGKYREIVDSAGVDTEIWKMHNWSGSYKPISQRKGNIKTCGRPFSPDIVIRAGGINGKTGGVHPCCQVLGNESASILGHFSEKSIQEIMTGRPYEQLREQHRTQNYPEFCKNCDFLIDDQEALVYTNCNRTMMHMNGTKFSLNEYR